LIALVRAEVRFGQLLRKEKDEASPPDLFSGGSSNFTSIPRLRCLEVFLFLNSSDLALVSQSQTFREYLLFRETK